MISMETLLLNRGKPSTCPHKLKTVHYNQTIDYRFNCEPNYRLLMLSKPLLQAHLATSSKIPLKPG